MSDGNFNRVRIYTKADVELLANKFGIYAGVMADKKDQYIITNELSKLVSHHILPV